MYPQITVFGMSVPTYGVCVGVGLLILFFYLIIILHKKHCLDREIYFILPKLLVSLIGGLFGAMLFDAVVKIPQNGGLKLSGMTFYGGLIAGFSIMICLLLIFRKTTFSPLEWLNVLTVPFVLFHCCGRIGCFFVGCCYGKPTDGPLGIVFPDLPEAGIFHNGQAVLPTQLIEAIMLGLLAIFLICLGKHQFFIYAYVYPVFRFVIEFFRDDDRGSYVGVLSPSQFVSVLIVAIVTFYIAMRLIVRRVALRKSRD